MASLHGRALTPTHLRVHLGQKMCDFSLWPVASALFGRDSQSLFIREMREHIQALWIFDLRLQLLHSLLSPARGFLAQQPAVRLLKKDAWILSVMQRHVQHSGRRAISWTHTSGTRIVLYPWVQHSFHYLSCSSTLRLDCGCATTREEATDDACIAWLRCISGLHYIDMTRQMMHFMKRHFMSSHGMAACSPRACVHAQLRLHVFTFHAFLSNPSAGITRSGCGGAVKQRRWCLNTVTDKSVCIRKWDV